MVKKLAMARGVSIAEFIRQAVEGIIHSSPAVDREERVKRGREIVGKYQFREKRCFPGSMMPNLFSPNTSF